MLPLSHLLSSHTHLAQPRYMALLSTFASLSRLSLHNAVRSRAVCNIVPYNMPKELPPYMSISTSEQSTTQNKPVLRMLLFGKPCSGKGTLAARLSKKYDISTISTGDLLRQHIAQRSVAFFGKFACYRVIDSCQDGHREASGRNCCRWRSPTRRNDARLDYH